MWAVKVQVIPLAFINDWPLFMQSADYHKHLQVCLTSMSQCDIFCHLFHSVETVRKRGEKQGYGDQGVPVRSWTVDTAVLWYVP